MALVLKHQTLAQFATRLRERYRTASKEELAKIARFIINRINAGDITELQVRNAFGLTVTQWNTLKAKMIALKNNYDGLQSAQGE